MNSGGTKMNFKNKLTFTESILMVREIADSVFSTDENGTTTYLPYLYDFAHRLAIAKYYGGYEMACNDADYETAMNINVNSLLNGTIDECQYQGIKAAVKELISFKKEEAHKTNITITSQLDGLVPLVGGTLADTLQTVNQKLSDIDMKELSGQPGNLNITKLIEEYGNSTKTPDCE